MSEVSHLSSLLPVAANKDPNQQFINCTEFKTFVFLEATRSLLLGLTELGPGSSGI